MSSRPPATSYSKINLNLAILFKIKLIFRKWKERKTIIRGNTGRFSQVGVWGWEERLLWGHLLISWYSLLISHFPFSGMLRFTAWIFLPASVEHHLPKPGCMWRLRVWSLLLVWLGLNPASLFTSYMPWVKDLTSLCFSFLIPFFFN